jgi:hypothetical protein
MAQKEKEMNDKIAQEEAKANKELQTKLKEQDIKNNQIL